MKTSVSFWDALFGERIEMDIPMPKGGIKKVSVTKKWLDQMELEGKLKPITASSKKTQPDPLFKRAEDLVQTASINAIGMSTTLFERFPILNKVDVEHFNFILTVVSVFIAATRLNNLRLSEDREDRIMEIVSEKLNRWKPDGIQGFEDCKKLFESEFDRLTEAGHERSFVASDALGVWIVWNLLGHPAQNDEEYQLVRTIGGVLTSTFFNWWDN